MTKKTQEMTKSDIADALSLLHNTWLQQRYCRQPSDPQAWMLRFVFDAPSRRDLLAMAKEYGVMIPNR